MNTCIQDDDNGKERILDLIIKGYQHTKAGRHRVGRQVLEEAMFLIRTIK